MFTAKSALADHDDLHCHLRLIAGSKPGPPGRPIGSEPVMVPRTGKSASSSFVYYSSDQG